MKKFIFSPLGEIFLLVILLRLPSLFEPYWYGDEGIYLAVGQGIRRGALLYRDVWDNKPPLLYLLYALMPSLFWAKVAAICATIGVVGAIKAITQKITSEKIANWSALLFGVLASAPILEGNIANGEIFMMLPVLWGIYLILTAEKDKHYFWAGLLFALGVLVKVPIAFEALAAVAWLVIMRDKPLKLLRSLMLIVVGGTVPVAIVVGFFVWQGAFPDFWQAVGASNATYVNWKSAAGIIPFGALGLRAVGVGVAAIGVWCLSRLKATKNEVFILWWFLAALFGTTLSGRWYPHYLLQLAAPLTVLMVYVVFSKKIFLGGWLVFLIGAIFLKGQFSQQIPWKWPLEYYRNFYQTATGQKDVYEYRNFFDSRVNRNYRIAEFIKNRTSIKEKIFVWGDEALIYALAERGDASRFVAAHHVEWLKKYQEVEKDLRTQKPKFIVVIRPVQYAFAGLEKLLSQEYNLWRVIEEAEIYERNPLFSQ